MKRRTALMALAAITGALVGKKVMANDNVTTTVTPDWPPKPGDVFFDLRTWGSYRFTLDGEEIVVTPEELFAALKEDR